MDTIGVFNSGLRGNNTAQLTALHGPVLLINGHERDFLMASSRATFDALETLPAFYGARRGAGHTATVDHLGSGELGERRVELAAMAVQKRQAGCEDVRGQGLQSLHEPELGNGSEAAAVASHPPCGADSGDRVSSDRRTRFGAMQRIGHY